MILFALGRVIINRVALAEAYPWLIKVMTVSLILHLLAGSAQIFVTQHFYHGISDWTRYTHQGALLAPDFRHFNFTLAGANVRQIVNDGSVSIATGIVMTLVGANDLATFLVFSWLSFLGAVLFFRAFSLTFRGADPHRYALLVFVFPSLIFWTADASKEAIMTIALALVAYGTAKILARQKGGFVLLIPGSVLAVYIRPNELVLILAAFVVALVVPTANVRQNYGGVRRVIGVIFCAVLLLVSFKLTQHYLVRNGSVSGQLQTTSKNNSLAGSGGIPYSTNPATYSRDVYEVLLNPLPVNFHGFGELIAAAENTLLLGLLFMSLRQLRMIPRAAFARPYVMMCLVYSASFFYGSPPSATSDSSNGSDRCCSHSSSSSSVSPEPPRARDTPTTGSSAAALACSADRPSRPPGRDGRGRTIHQSLTAPEPAGTAQHRVLARSSGSTAGRCPWSALQPMTNSATRTLRRHPALVARLTEA